MSDLGADEIFNSGFVNLFGALILTKSKGLFGFTSLLNFAFHFWWLVDLGISILTQSSLDVIGSVYPMARL